MRIENIMTTDILTISPGTTLREAARRMSERNAGAALIVDTTVGTRPGILTERDVLDSVAAGQDPDVESVDEHLTPNAVSVAVDSSLEQAVQKMTEGNFRHLLVVHGDDAVGVVSMRDLVLALVNQ